MKTVAEIRRLNLLLLVAEAGSQAAVAERVGTSPVYVSQLLKRARDSSSGRPRAMGDDMARRLEAAFGKPEGWMDAEHQHAPLREPAAPYRVPAPPPHDFAERREPSNSEWQFLQDLRSLPVEDREALMRRMHDDAEKFRRLVRAEIARIKAAGGLD